MRLFPAGMTKHPVRSAMETALREIVVAHLRERGFAGSFPHFRRPQATHIELVTFQFYSSGGSFVVELATCPSAGVVHPWGKVVTPSKVTAHDVLRRHRLGSQGHGDHWFVFGKRNYEDGHEVLAPDSHYLAVAENVRRLLAEEGEAYWYRAAQQGPAADERPQAGDRG
jgi:hypothetical protein